MVTLLYLDQGCRVIPTSFSNVSSQLLLWILLRRLG